MSRSDPFSVFGCRLHPGMIIEASAGTGKTYTIAGMYIRLLLEKRITPDRILVITFTRMATKELKERVLERLRLSLQAVESGREQDDPYLYCMPQGVVRGQPYPWRFVQNYTHKPPTHLFKLEEGNIHSFRQIFMDGRKHPAELDPTWLGHSIGHWEKDTLVIDTVGYNDKFWFDRKGTPHTERLHTIERWTRINMGNLVNEVTIDDPGAYSRPFTVTFNARLGPPTDDLMENICQENNQFGVAGGHTNPFAGK